MYFRTDLEIVLLEPQANGLTLVEGIAVDGTRMMFAMRLGSSLMVGDVLGLALKLDLEARSAAAKGGRLRLGTQGAAVGNAGSTSPQTDLLDDFIVERDIDAELDLLSGPPVKR